MDIACLCEAALSRCINEKLVSLWLLHYSVVITVPPKTSTDGNLIPFCAAVLYVTLKTFFFFFPAPYPTLYTCCKEVFPQTKSLILHKSHSFWE